MDFEELEDVMTDDEKRSMFNRQRRNLMGMSIIVLFVTYSGLEFKKLNILGNELDVKNPQIVYYALWIAFAYWFIRYFQFLQELRHDTATEIYKQKLFSVTWPSADLLFKAEIQEKYGNKIQESNPHAHMWATMPSLFNPFFKRRIRVFCNVRLTDGGVSYTENYEKVIELHDGRKIDFRNWWLSINHTIWRTSSVSEYIFPQLLATFVVLACVIRNL